MNETIITKLVLKKSGPVLAWPTGPVPPALYTYTNYSIEGIGQGYLK